MGSMHFDSSLLSSSSLHRPHSSPWWRRHFSPPLPLTPCPVVDVLNVTVELKPSYLTEQTFPSPSPPFHYTWSVTSQSLRLDGVDLHLSLNSTADGGHASDGSYPMTLHPQGREGMREAQWMWEHRMGGRLHGTEEADFAFSIHYNHCSCDTDVTSTRISALFFPTNLLLTTAASSTPLQPEETSHHTTPLIEGLSPVPSNANAHPQDVEAAVLELLAQATFDPHPHYGEGERERMGGTAERVTMGMDGNGKMYAMPAATPVDPFSPHHQMHAAYPHGHHAGVGLSGLHGTEQVVPFSEYGRGGESGAGGVGQQCAGDDWWCQVNAVCQLCFNYEQPALCSPCAAVLRCQDRPCAHRAVIATPHN